jgi:hypothetical protein
MMTLLGGMEMRAFASRYRHIRFWATAALLTLTVGCSQPDRSSSAPTVDRPEGQRLITLAGSGVLGGHPWQVEVVEESGKLCLQDVIDGKVMSNTCEFKTDSKLLLLNFEVVGNDKVMFVSGAADPTITSLTLLSEPERSAQEIHIQELGGRAARVFGFAAEPGSVHDLIGRDSQGKEVVSGGEKIRSTSSRP